jgi:hypothetical protein
MPDPAGDKIKIEWDDLNTRKVDQRLREQEALARNRQQADRVPVAAVEATARGFWSHPAIVMGLFGLLGGLLAWGAREGLRLRTDLKAEADAHRSELRVLDDQEESIQKQRIALQDLTKLSPNQAEKVAADVADFDKASAVKRNEINDGRQELVREYGDNPYFKIYADPSLTPAQTGAAVEQLDKDQAPKELIAQLLSFGLTGLLISACLSMAEPLSVGNRAGALLNGLIGAVLGLAGGVAAMVPSNWVYHQLNPGAAEPSREILAQAAKWGVLGLFLAIGPGVMSRNLKKCLICMAGGLIGGLIGGAAYSPVRAATNDSDWISWGIGLSLIGLTAGLMTGLIENAAKNGWVKVTAGLIAGKQFILYRNPTFIGSGPECPIYLFRDPKVGKRHAAIHVVPGGFELENLPLGDVTLVNDKPIVRTRLKAGDVIGVGATRFEFNEKRREKTA